jgi:hypothetical protein
MDLKAGKKRIILTISIICLVWLIFGVYLYIMNKPPFLPVKHTFDREAGIVAFKVDPKYSIDHIYLSEGGYYPQPLIDSKTTEVSFCAFDLAVGQHEFVYFICHKKDGKTDAIGVEFEILHQSDSEILIQVFENGRDFPGYRRTDSYSY